MSGHLRRVPRAVMCDDGGSVDALVDGGVGLPIASHGVRGSLPSVPAGLRALEKGEVLKLLLQRSSGGWAK
jgi:hypothetical protein